MDKQEQPIPLHSFSLTDEPKASTTPPSSQQQQQPYIPVQDPLLFAHNPGTYEDLHKKVKDIFPVCFDGFKFLLNKQISSHFLVSHTLTMSSILPSGYKFGATYIGNTYYSQQEVFPVILGDMDFNGNMNAQIIHQFNKNLRTRLVAQIQNSKLVGYQATNDYKGQRFTASVTLVNTDIVENAGLVISQYLQRVTKNLDVGAELIYQYGPTVPNSHIAVYSFGCRYSGKQWQLSGALNPLGSLHLCYYHQAPVTPIQFGVELETNIRTMESQSTFSYQLDLNRANMVFKGMVDSNWNVGAVLEKRLLPLPFTFILSGHLNHVQSTYRFGFGLTIG